MGTLPFCPCMAFHYSAIASLPIPSADFYSYLYITSLRCLLHFCHLHLFLQAVNTISVYIIIIFTEQTYNYSNYRLLWKWKLAGNALMMNSLFCHCEFVNCEACEYNDAQLNEINAQGVYKGHGRLDTCTTQFLCSCITTLC